MPTLFNTLDRILRLCFLARFIAELSVKSKMYSKSGAIDRLALATTNPRKFVESYLRQLIKKSRLKLIKISTQCSSLDQSYG